MKAKTLGSVTLCAAMLFAAAVSVETAFGQTSAPAAQTNDNDVATLKAQLAEQQKEIDALKAAMDEQKKLLQNSVSAGAARDSQDSFALPRNKALGEVASTTPILPPIAPVVAPVVSQGQSPAASGNP